MDMSEYFIQEQRLGTNTQTIVKNREGRALYLLIGHWGSKNDVLSLYHMDGALAARVKQTSMLVGRRFDLYLDVQKVGTLKKIFNWPGDFYYIGHLHWAVYGNIYHHQYAIRHFKRQVMTMDKRPFLKENYYVLTIDDPRDAPLCICIAAIMDYWLYNRKKEAEPYFIQPQFA